MRAVWSGLTKVVVAVILVTGLGMAPAAAKPPEPFRCLDYVITEGEIIEIDETSITVHQWAGVYTYLLDPTERWKLQADQIGPGDKVRFLTCGVGKIAKEFKRIEGQ